MDYNKITKKIETNISRLNDLIDHDELIKAKRLIQTIGKQLEKLRVRSEKSEYLTQSYTAYEENFKQACNIYKEKIKLNLYSMSL